MRGVSLGAPPDAFNPKGQNWGLAPFAPQVLRAHDLEPSAADCRAGFESTGALEIDHVMGLARWFWIPNGALPDEGTYVRFPFVALAGRLAQEARARGCLGIGEDLGTLPAGFRARMCRRRMLGIRVLWFKRTARGGFRPPEGFARLALACLSTHDQPNLRGFLEGRDIAWNGSASSTRRPQRLNVGPTRGTCERGSRPSRAGSVGADGADPAAIAVPSIACSPAAARHWWWRRSKISRARSNSPTDCAQSTNIRTGSGRVPVTVGALFGIPLSRAIFDTLRRQRGR